MRNSKTLARIRNGEPVRICALGHYIPPYIKMAADAGFDCIWFDLEHRAMHDREVQSLLGLFHLFDIDCLVRPSTRERARLYRYLEDGAAGLMMPHVSTPEVAQEIVNAVKFPPIGDRGLDGAGFDSDYLGHSADDYVAHVNQETFLVLQIETPAAVERADEIISIDGVDGIFVGPGDLGLRLRQQGRGDELETMIARVADSCQRHGKAWGMPAGTPEAVRQRRDQGAQLLAVAGEFMMIKNGLEAAIQYFE